MNPHLKYYLVDIDGTLTDYKPGALAPEKLLGGNFLFPIIRDMMAELGWEKSQAETSIIQLTKDVPYWDYTDFIAEFNLPVEKAFRLFRKWHSDNMTAYQPTVEMIRRISASSKLFVMSNNPYSGCLMKLEVAGLADTFSAPCFTRIFGTNLLRGCKWDLNVWKRALAQIPAPSNEIGVIGDNPEEDGRIPSSLGVGETIIVKRDALPQGAVASK